MCKDHTPASVFQLLVIPPFYHAIVWSAAFAPVLHFLQFFAVNYFPGRQRPEFQWTQLAMQIAPRIEIQSVQVQQIPVHVPALPVFK